MTIDTLNLAISIGELIVFIIFFVYLLRKTDWKQEREYERLRLIPARRQLLIGLLLTSLFHGLHEFFRRNRMDIGIIEFIRRIRTGNRVR